MELRHVAVVSSGRKLINEARERKSVCRINSTAISEMQERENEAKKRTGNDVRKNSLHGSEYLHLPRNFFHHNSFAKALLKKQHGWQVSAYRS